MRTATAIVIAIMLAASPAFAGGHGHGGHGGGHGNASHSSSHASAKADRASARADRKAEHKAAKKQSITPATDGSWDAHFSVPSPDDPGAYTVGFGSFAMQPNGKFSGSFADVQQPDGTIASPTGKAAAIRGKVNLSTGAIKGRSGLGKITGTYTPDDPYFERSEMGGDILGKHGADIGDWVADGPDALSWE